MTETESATGDGGIVRASRMRFPGISPRAYEHPADRGAMASLRAVPGVSEVLRAAAGLFSERGERLMTLASAIRVGEKQYPVINRLRLECAETLDLPTVPVVYVARDAAVNAFAIGIDQPFIVLTTDLVESLDTEALRFVIGHEMGHILSGHAVLRTLLIRLINLQASMSFIPLGALGMRAVIAALREWFRKAELTCDRAGLLCSQDPRAALRCHVYLAGGTDLSQIDIPSFLAQADEYEKIEDVRDSIHKLRNVEVLTHPLAVVRAAQLQRWAATEEYRDPVGPLPAPRRRRPRFDVHRRPALRRGLLPRQRHQLDGPAGQGAERGRIHGRRGRRQAVPRVRWEQRRRPEVT